ncbi:MAG: baseplate J/gp47 family protein [Bacteroidota bacterium]
MIGNVKSNPLLYRDGTSQQDRYREALDPAYVQVEGRRPEELIREAQRLAQEIQFFDDQNHPAANWEALLIDDAEAYRRKGETGRAIQRRQWAEKLAAYAQHPERFRNDPEALARLSRPHVVLFLTFLQLLNHIKTQINGLTEKHLDFFFRERLGFTPKAAVPDVVNVLLELAAEVGQLEVKAGTVLFAGKDAEGNELHYRTDRDTVISEAQIAQVKTVFVDKTIRTVRDVHAEHRRDLDKGFLPMLEIALGQPEPGDPLPEFPAGVGNLLQLASLLENGNAAAERYVAESLGFSRQDNFRDFRRLMDIHRNDLNSTVSVEPSDWELVYQILERAYQNRWKIGRRAELRTIRESGGLEGVARLQKHVFGRPEPGDDLPLYRGKIAVFADVFADLTAGENQRHEANEYILEELRLITEDFVKLVQVTGKSAATAEEWDSVYAILELADRKLRSLPLPVPVRHELANVYAEPDAPATAFSLYGEAGESKRFKTFGGDRPGSETPLRPANLGFAVSSPLIQLYEGRRKLTATLALDPERGDREELRELFAGSEPETAPFTVLLTGENGWFAPDQVQFTFGDFVVGEPESLPALVIDGGEARVRSGRDFDDTDLGKYLVDNDGTVYEIVHRKSDREVVLRAIGQVAARPQIEQYAPEGIYLNAVQARIDLQEEEPPVQPLGQGVNDALVHSEFPALALVLRHFSDPTAPSSALLSHYQSLVDLRLERVHLQVEVAGIRTMTLLNDRTELDPKKPFEPFGVAPEIGNSFYVASPEISQKRLDALALELTWMKLPEDFREHYANYWKVQADDDRLAPAAYRIQGEGDFRARVFLYDGRAELEIADAGLFSRGGKIEIGGIPARIAEIARGFNYESRTDYRTQGEVTEWDRYFRLELDHRDFQRAVYDRLFRKQALSQKAAVRNLDLNPPYVPKLKQVRLGYTAHTEISVTELNTTGEDRLYHVHPFGHRRLTAGELPHLLPVYPHAGELYLGLDRLRTPQILSLLFQMSEGSADPEVATPRLHWSYLREDNWVGLPESALLSDTTNGLMNTGIIQIAIPADATGKNCLLPGAHHWLKISCAGSTGGISDTIQVLTQAVSATLSSQAVAPQHFVDLLPAESITETQEFNPAIQKITQPYTSRKGKPAEQDATFYTRISERLRHKNRALSMWDYERMVLEQFPEVYKVKCLPATPEPHNPALGQVNVLVIPDIRGKLPFNPFAPKVPTDTVLRIQQFLDERTPAFAEVRVGNPTFLQVKVRCTVKFKPGYNEGFYRPKLVDELKQFLAPWAYGEGEKISIGGTMYASVIVNFIAERPYIDYVANLKLFQSEDGRRFTDVRAIHDRKNQVTVTRPDTVLVSAPTHEIDIVDENGYDEDKFEGINFMKVELDFEVGEDLIP